MSDIYVFRPSDDDYDSMGVVGALTPTECTFEESANGESIISLIHPIDEFGRYAALERGNILVVPVPVRTTPEIQNGRVVSTVWTYRIKNTITARSQRTLYKRSTGGKKKIMKVGDTFTVVYKPDGDGPWKVKTKYGTGWVVSDPNGAAFELVETHNVPENNANYIQEIQSPWTITDQYFRIYETKKGIDSISVSARHISYDLLYNVTGYDSGVETELQSAINGILSGCYENHEFKGYTNLANVQTGLYYNGKNPIDAFLDPEEGICAKYKVGFVRDNYELFFLQDPGINRGVHIRYGKNMTGIDFTESDDEVVTRIIPVGELKNGDELYLSNNKSERYIDISDYVESHPDIAGSVPDYPFSHVYVLECENCKVGDKDTGGGTVTVAIARARMREQANKMFADGCYNPKIQMSVEFVNLGDSEEYAQFKNLEDCFLFDYVIVQHPRLMVDVTAQIVKIKWDCIRDRMTGVEIGSVGETIANMGITTWQIPAGFSGSKIAAKTIGSKPLQANIISAEHIQANTINVKHLNAGTITTDELYATLAHIAAMEVTDASIEHANINHADIKEAALELARIAQAKIDEAEIGEGYIERAEIDEANIAKLIATLAEIERADIDKASIEHADVHEALIDWAGIQNLTAQTAAIAKANVGDVSIDLANINWANIVTLSSQLADIAQARINHADIDVGVIEQLSSTVNNTITLTAQNANMEFATAQRLVTSAMIMDQGIGGTLTIENLIATSAMFVQATLGKLTLKGDDGYYYDVTVAADGTIHTENLGYNDSDIIDGIAPNGKPVVATQAAIDELNSTNIRTQGLIANDIFTKALEAEVITASDAFIASATIPQLYVTAITALGDTLTISAERIFLQAGGDIESLTLSDYVEDTDTNMEAIDNDLQEIRNSADAAMNAIQSLVVGGVNLIDDSSEIVITGTDNPATSYVELASGLSPGTVYTLSMASAILTQAGNVPAPGMTLEAVRLPDTEAGESQETVFFDQLLDFSGGHQKYTFVTSDDGHTYALRLYAGQKGSSNGQVVTVEKVKLEEGSVATMWTESLEDTERKLSSITTTLSETWDGLQASISHVTNNVDGTIEKVNSYFRFATENNQPTLTIGKNESKLTMKLTNSRLSFLWGNEGSKTELAYFSDNKLYVTNVEAIERLTVGTSNNGYLDIVTTNTGVGFMWRSGS